jgi:hypothetical protein
MRCGDYLSAFIAKREVFRSHPQGGHPLFKLAGSRGRQANPTTP